MGTVEVVLKSKVTSKLFRVYVDGTRVLFKNGSARLWLASPDRDHVLMWFIQDRPGTPYGLEIAEPKAVKMSIQATLDASGKDAGVYWFKL